jgi:hypothetical protein
MDVANPRTTRLSLVRWMGQPRPDQTTGGSVGGGTRAIQPQRARHAAAGSLQSTDPEPRSPPAGLVNTLPLRMLEEEAGHQPIRRVGPWLNPPSTTARMMNILEAEGGREAAARLASPHHKAGGHPPG